jgi:hypothetical protein
MLIVALPNRRVGAGTSPARERGWGVAMSEQRSPFHAFEAGEGVRRRGEDPLRLALRARLEGGRVDGGVASGWEAPLSRIWGEGVYGEKKRGYRETEGESEAHARSRRTGTCKRLLTVTMCSSHRKEKHLIQQASLGTRRSRQQWLTKTDHGAVQEPGQR